MLAREVSPQSQQIASCTSELLNRYHYTCQRYGKDSDCSVRLRNAIAKANAGLVYRLAHRYHKNSREPYKDLEQVGQIGLIRAVEGYDLARNLAFSSYAIPMIRGEILHYLRDKTNLLKLPRRWQELYSKGQSNKRQIGLKTGLSPSESEIARSLNIPSSDWQEIRQAHNANLIQDIDNHQESEKLTFTIELCDFCWEDEIEKLRAAIACLEQKERDATLSIISKKPSKKQPFSDAEIREGLECLAIAMDRGRF